MSLKDSKEQAIKIIKVYENIFFSYGYLFFINF
jgi:hypothetical protein